MTQLVIILAYLGLLLGLGVASSRLFRGTSVDYMLASHSIGPVLLLMSLFGTTMTAFALVGSTGEAYTAGVGVYGMLASASGIVHSLCFFLVGMKLWTLGRRYDYRTQVQFFRDRFGSDAIGLLLFPILVILVIPYLLIGVISSGIVINKATLGAFAGLGWFTGAEHAVPQWLASLFICLVVLTYVFLGGMRGTAWANTLQTLVFMILGVITFFTIARGIGGSENLLSNLRHASSQVPDAYLSREKIPWSVYFSFLFIPFSVAMFPHVFQHWLTARSAGTFKLPIIAHPIFIMIVWLPCILLGVWARGDGLNVDPNSVLAVLVQQHAGAWLAGLLSAGILAAIMSSLDSQFLCLGTIFTEDIVLHYGGEKRFSDRQTVLLARGFVVAVVALTYGLSLIAPQKIFALAIWCFSGFTGLFPLVIGALYWRRLTKAGAFAGLLTTAVAWCIFFWRADFAANTRYTFPEAAVTVGELVLLPPLKPVVAITLFSAVAMVVVSLVTPRLSEERLARFFPEKKSVSR